MFTEGLDENAIKWVKQGSDVPQQARRPLVEHDLADPLPDTPFFYSSRSLLSPKDLPPVKFHSGLLHSNPMNYAASEDDEESVASVPDDLYANYSDVFEDDGLLSSDSDLFERPKGKCSEDEVKSSRTSTSHETVSTAGNVNRHTLVRGLSKENLRVDVPVNVACTIGGVANSPCTQRDLISSSIAKDQIRISSSKENMFSDVHYDESMPHTYELGTPSAPPMVGHIPEDIYLEVGDKDWKGSAGEKRASYSASMDQLTDETYFSDGTKVVFRNMEFYSDTGREQQKANQIPSRFGNEQIPSQKTSMADHIPSYTTSAQNAWQTFVAYDACFRLCLSAWSRNCTEAPEFLRDECTVLRDAFGLQKFLLQPQGFIKGEGGQIEKTDGTHGLRHKKVINQIEIEVKKIRILSRRTKLQTILSQKTIYVEVGAQYVRHVSAMLKSRIKSLKATSFPVGPEESLSCLLQLKSSSEDAATQSGSIVCLKPGAANSHVFYPESQLDVILIEIQDADKVNQGYAKVHITELADCHEQQGELTRWWPVYLNTNDCVGKIQLCINISRTPDAFGCAQGIVPVETLIYDLVLEAAMRAQTFHSKNLHIHGKWRWLLNEFADYYGISDAYTNLRYLLYIMNVSTPTKDCLELIYELLLPIIKARAEKILSRQERSIYLEFEDQVKGLLATTFENYKSLDEDSPTGLAEFFSPIVDYAAPALVPAVQVFTLVHDILSLEAQSVLRNYLQNAAAKRCRWHMMETDEFLSSSHDGFLTDPMTVSTAYLKMKTLCINIGNEIQADIKIHNQHILPSSIDLPNITASFYSTELSKRLSNFLAACPPSKPSPHVTTLLIASADFESNLSSWNISPIHGGLVSKDLFHNYIMVWIQDMRLHLLDVCKSEKMQCSGIMTNYSSSHFAETLYDEIKDKLNEYEVIVRRWPQYLLSIEIAVADVERAIFRALEKQYNDVLMPLRDGIPKMLEKQVQKITRRQSTPVYITPGQLGIFLNTVKRILDVLHGRVENILKSWASYMANIGDNNLTFGEQMNGITVLLRKKYKRYMEAIIEQLVVNVQTNRTTKLRRILEETKEAEGESETRERMQALCYQVGDCIRTLHTVFSNRIFVAICRGFWDRMGQIILKFLESRKENRIWYRGSGYALGILEDLFASEMQSLLGNNLEPKDLDPPRSVNEARSILC